MSKEIPDINYLRRKRKVGALIKCLRFDNKQCQIEAIKALGEIKNIRAVKHLKKFLYSNDRILMKFSADSLSRIICEESFIAFVSALNQQDKDNIIILIKALENYGSSSAIKYLLPKLNNLDDEISKTAFNCILSLNRNQKLEPLKQGLKNERESIRLQALRNVINIDDVEVKSILLDSLLDKNHTIREEAVYLLSEYTNDSDITEQLLTLLNDTSMLVKIRAANKLISMKIKDSRIPEILIRAYFYEDPEIRKYSIANISKLRINNS